MHEIEASRKYTDRQVADNLSIGRSTLWGWVAQGNFPAPEKIGPRTSRWSGQALLEWEQSIEQQRVTGRNTVPSIHSPKKVQHD